MSHTDLVDRPVSKAHTSWYHQDMRGSTMMLSSTEGQAVASYAYDAFGVVFDDHPAVGRPQPTVPEIARPAVERGTEYLYTGKRLDPETGVYDYASRLARFTTVDPINDGSNWNAYVGNDPVNRIDPLGLAAADAAVAEQAAETIATKVPVIGGGTTVVAGGKAEFSVVTDSEGRGGIAVTVAGGTGMEANLPLPRVLSVFSSQGGRAASGTERRMGTIHSFEGPGRDVSVHIIGGVTRDLDFGTSRFSVAPSLGGGAYATYTKVYQLWGPEE